MQNNISVIIPAYNEEKTIKEAITGLKKELTNLPLDYEIIVVNDGSTDKTKEIIERVPDIKLISHAANKGYGAAIKTGVKNSRYDRVLFFDADGQHKPEYIKDLIKHADDCEMVIGQRTGYKGPILRQPGKKFLTWLAGYLVEQKILDINSGLRLIKKGEFLKFIHLFPDSFSISTTSTLAFLKEGLGIKYVPITINKRGADTKSSVKMKHGFQTILLMLRIIMIFNPLKIFLPISLAAGFLTFIFLIYDIATFNVSEVTIMLFTAAVLIFCFGLLADQMSAIRREKQ